MAHPGPKKTSAEAEVVGSPGRIRTAGQAINSRFGLRKNYSSAKRLLCVNQGSWRIDLRYKLELLAGLKPTKRYPKAHRETAQVEIFSARFSISFGSQLE